MTNLTHDFDIESFVFARGAVKMAVCGGLDTNESVIAEE